MGNTKPAANKTANESTPSQPFSADEVKNILGVLLPEMLASALPGALLVALPDALVIVLPDAVAAQLEKVPPAIDTASLVEQLTTAVRANLQDVIKEIMPDILPDMLAAQLPGALADERNAQAANVEADSEQRAQADADARAAAHAEGQARMAAQEKADAAAAKAAAKKREEAYREATGAYADALSARELGAAAKPGNGECVIRFGDGSTFYTGRPPIVVTRDMFTVDRGAVIYARPITFDATADPVKLTEAWLIDGEGGATRCMLGSAIMVGGGMDALIPANHLLFRPEPAQPST